MHSASKAINNNVFEINIDIVVFEVNIDIVVGYRMYRYICGVYIVDRIFCVTRLQNSLLKLTRSAIQFLPSFPRGY